MTSLQKLARRTKLVIEPRENVSGFARTVALLLALLGAVLVTALLLRTAGAEIGPAFSALLSGAFGSRRSVLETLVRAAPLILTGLSVTLAYRGRIWTIGSEGQLFAGAMAGYWALNLFGWLPRFPLFIVILLFSFSGGAVLGWLAGILKVRFSVDEIISTVMMNYIIIFFLSFMLSGSGPWRQEGSFYQQSAELPESANFLVLFPNSRLHIGFVIALVSAVLIHLLLTRTPLGYEIRALGSNPVAMKFKGVNVPRTIITTLILSGGLAGLAGAGELFGIHQRLVLDLSNGLGFTGIIVAMLAGLNPLGVILVAVLFGGLVNGGFRLQVATGIPSAFILAIQAIVLLFAISASVISRYRLRRRVDVE